MKNNVKIIGFILFVVLLISPIKVNATEPSYMYPLGIVVEIEGCTDTTTYGDFFVDVIVSRDDYTNEPSEEPRDINGLPSALLNSEYADPENEWMSLILFDEYDSWHYDGCRILFYEFVYNEHDFPFSEYKVVVYEQGQEPVISKTYFTSNSATWVEPSGFMIVYNSEDQEFSLKGYEAEMMGGYDPGFFNSLQFLVAAFVTVIVVVFGLMESIIYLIARQGKKAVLIPLGFNLLALGYVVSQFVEVFRLSEELYAIFGILLIPNLFVGKVLLLNKYAAMVYKVSILFSTIFYSIYFFFFIQAMW